MILGSRSLALWGLSGVVEKSPAVGRTRMGKLQLMSVVAWVVFRRRWHPERVFFVGHVYHDTSALNVCFSDRR